MHSVASSIILPKIRLLYHVRNASQGYWNRDWKPGPYPETEKQRQAAAKKYNLLPHEYEPYKEGEEIITPGDYPKLPDVSNENKDVYYQWDLPDERRNFGEPMHINSIFFTEDRVDTHWREKRKYSPLTMFASLAGAVGFLFALKLADDFKCFPPVAARHMPKDGVSHYSYSV